MEEIVNMIVNNGMSVVICGYFLWKDKHFNDQIVSVLSEIKTVLEVMRTK